MAMKPFCGYNFADYWSHWLSFAERSDKLPRIFHVNWFRQDADGEFLWPGFGENLRVLNWIIDRCEGQVEARETPIGYLPYVEDLNTTDLEISAEALETLTHIDRDQWRAELRSFGEYLETYGDRLPDALRQQQQKIASELG
jgi:phosphoenolpyruvate carboxykinase (GTP)